MTLFDALTIGIAVLCVGAFVLAVRRTGDTLHPVAFLSPMALIAYAVAPSELAHLGLLGQSGISANELTLVQFVNLVTIGGLFVGVARGGTGARAFPGDGLPTQWSPPRAAEVRLLRFALVLGGLAVFAFLWGLQNVGGFAAAYGGVKGGGTAESGYARDAVMLAVPAVALFAVATAAKRRDAAYWAFAAIVVGPLLLHGVLSGRRGPTFLAVVAAAFAWYLSRRRRPSAITLLAGGAAIGLALLLLVTFRGEFNLGSDLATNPIDTVGRMVSQFESERAAALERNLGGVEFVFGANVIRSYIEDGNYFWGRRVATVLFVRPIPKELWPTKYEDVGMDAYLTNVGLSLREDMGLDATLGAAPGFVADLFAEFSWGGLIVAYILGWCYGRAWLGARTAGGLWIPAYTIAGALSLYFVAQTLEAILFRAAFMAVPAYVAWRLAVAPTAQGRRGSAQMRARA